MVVFCFFDGSLGYATGRSGAQADILYVTGADAGPREGGRCRNLQAQA